MNGLSSSKATAGLDKISSKVLDFVDRDTLISVYNALIRPHFDYCSEVWDTLGNGLSNRLQKLQNRAARVVLGMSNDIPGSEALDMLGWQPLETRRANTKLEQCICTKF